MLLVTILYMLLIFTRCVFYCIQMYIKHKFLCKWFHASFVDQRFLCCHELCDLQNNIFIEAWSGLRTRAWGVWSGNETSAEKKLAYGERIFYTAGRFYWLLFAIVIHALLNILLGVFFNDATVCICCWISYVYNLRLHWGISQFTKTLGSFNCCDSLSL